MQTDLVLLTKVVPRPSPPNPSSKGVTTSLEPIYNVVGKNGGFFHFITTFS